MKTFTSADNGNRGIHEGTRIEYTAKEESRIIKIIVFVLLIVLPVIVWNLPKILGG